VVIKTIKTSRGLQFMPKEEAIQVEGTIVEPLYFRKNAYAFYKNSSRGQSNGRTFSV
jgi:hypothetical protein